MIKSHLKKRRRGKWIFGILLLLLAISLMPLFMMFFTSVIPQGDLFHLIREKTLLEFESNPIFLRTKMKPLGTRDYEIVEGPAETGKVMKIDITEGNKEAGVAAFTGDRNTNLFDRITLYVKAPKNSNLYLGIKDINDNLQVSESGIELSGTFERVAIEYEKSEFPNVDHEHVSQLQFFVELPSGLNKGEVLFDEIGTKLKFPTFSNFIDVWQEHNFARYIFNSSLVSFIVVLGNLIFCSMVAYAFARKQFKGKEVLFAMVLATMMIPPQVTIIPIFILMKNIGWVDTYMALFFPFLVTPFGVFLMRQYIEQLPHEFDEAAYVDGANDFQIFTRIVMPLSGPAMAVLGINTFITIWNDLFYPLVMTNSKGMRTVQVGLAMFQKLNQTDWPRMMAASTIAGIPVIIIFLIFQRQIISGLVEGGVKG